MSSCSSNGMSALVALLTVGSQNEDINKNPQVSLFVYAHLRVTHFSQVIHNMNNASGDNSLTCGEQSFTFARNGDLLNQPYLRVDLPGIANGIKAKTDTFQFPDDYFDAVQHWPSSGHAITSTFKFSSIGEVLLHGNASTADANFLTTLAADKANKDLGAAIKTFTGNEPANQTIQNVVDYALTKKSAQDIPLRVRSCLAWDPELRAIVQETDYDKIAIVGESTKLLEAGDCLQLIESCAERTRAHVEATANGENALTHPGPECYWAWGVGYALVECMTLCMGNQQIDRSYGQWMSMWEELTDSTSNSTDNSMYAHTQAEYSGHIHPNTHCNFKTSVENRKRLSKRQSTVFVPVTLGWARTAAMSMPLVACTFNNVTVSLRTPNLTSLIMNYGPELEARSGVARDWLSDNNNITIPGVSTLFSNYVLDSSVKTYVLEACGSTIGRFGGSCAPQYGYRVHTKETPALLAEVKQGDAQVRLVANYVFLQQGERQKFAEGSHEQIIVQTQRQCESVSGCSVNVNSCSFHHPSAGVFAAVSADPNTVGVNREPLDANAGVDSVNHTVRPAITHFNLSLNNAKVLPSSYDCELARYGDANAYNSLFRGAASKIQNGSVALLFCTDAMRALIQPSGTVNFSRVDELCFSFRIAPEIAKVGERDHNVRQHAGGDAIAKSISETPVLQLTLYAINYNVIRYKAGMAGCKWAL